MRRVMNCTILALCGFTIIAATASADVVIRLPNGQTIIVKAPVNVHVGPPGVVVETAPAKVVVNKGAPGVKKMDGAEPPLPSPRPVTDIAEKLPPPMAANAVAVAPSEFAKSFKPSPVAANYEVLFQHPVSDIPVTVAFTLPAGTPQVSFDINKLRFDYGQGREVVLNFEDANRVVVSQK